jgi:hypothetical protein
MTNNVQKVINRDQPIPSQHLGGENNGGDQGF